MFLTHSFALSAIEQNNSSGQYLSNFVSYNTLPKNTEIFQKLLVLAGLKAWVCKDSSQLR